MLRKQIEDFCNTLGLECVGFMPCRKFTELKAFYETRQGMGLQNEFEEKEIEKRINPYLYMPEGKTILSIAFPYKDKSETKLNGFSIYTQRMDYHRVVNKYLQQISEYLQSLGGKTISFVDSNALPERYIAYLSGVGFIGRNNMLITKKYGSYVFLGEIITDLKIECEESGKKEAISQHAACGECTLCIGECPTKSIHKGGCNPNICLSYITQKKEITNQEMQLLKGNIFGCDFCQLKCPYNENAASTPLEDFAVLDYMQEDAAQYAGMDNKYFKEKVSQTSCGWRGKNVIRRNAIIHMAHKGQDIEMFKGDSPYVNNYIERLSSHEDKYINEQSGNNKKDFLKARK